MVNSPSSNTPKDKIKEKLERLRVEGETANARAEKAEAEVKTLKEELTHKENAESQLKNKVSLLQMDLERQEKRVEEVCVCDCCFYFIVIRSRNDRSPETRIRKRLRVCDKRCSFWSFSWKARKRSARMCSTSKFPHPHSYAFHPSIHPSISHLNHI